MMRLRLRVFRKYHISDVVPFSIRHYQEAHGVGVSQLWVMLTWVIWLRLGSAMFLHCKVTMFPFVITKYLIGREILETMQVSSFTSHLHTLILASMNDFCIQHLLLW